MLAFTVMTPAFAQQRLSGRIAGFNCGDNCYLTIKTDAGREVDGLCVAKACRPWNEATELPAKLEGRRVVVRVGSSKQYDGDGNVMGRYRSFEDIQFAD
ncbi:hypothetical protein SLNSH_09920 [Alsobacter soli]|uniref:Uncharacterized protein n=2 Tax=Alsobacter soli TaxID=2109933 RepID=A0A2T1HU59_9HYPH|nr:hypothetical protein SLNSH_09920 [Alsobacter soli]